MDFDIVSDLNGSDDTTVNVHANDVSSNGGDAVQIDNQKPAAAPKAEPVVDPNAPEPKKPQSLRDTITSALKADAAATTPPGNQQDGGPARNPDGTFAKVEPPASPEPPADTTPRAPVAAPVGIDPQVFASLPAETQASLARTMEDVTNQQQRVAWLSPLEQVITPERINAWALNGGMQPAQAIHQLLALSDFAGRDPAGFIKYIAQNNGVDLEELVLGMDDEPVDPVIAGLQKQVAELQGARTQEQQQAQAAAHQRTVNEVVAFAEEKDAQGNLVRPYLDDLGDAFMPYISMVKAQNPNWSNAQVMQQAYENACWANPTVRGKMQEAANKAAEAERLRKEAERIANARNASASVPAGAPASPPPAPDTPGRSTRDVIRDAIAKHS